METVDECSKWHSYAMLCYAAHLPNPESISKLQASLITPPQAHSHSLHISKSQSFALHLIWHLRTATPPPLSRNTNQQARRPHRFSLKVASRPKLRPSGSAQPLSLTSPHSTPSLTHLKRLSKDLFNGSEGSSDGSSGDSDGSGSPGDSPSPSPSSPPSKSTPSAVCSSSLAAWRWL
jgi:hypothetical protein